MVVNPHRIAIVISLYLLGYLIGISATGCREEATARKNESVVLGGRELLIHQGFILDTLQHLPSPPCHLPAINVYVVEFLYIPRPFLFLAGQLAIPVDLVDLIVGRD